MDENGDRGTAAPMQSSRWRFDEVQWDEPGGVVRIVYSNLQSWAEPVANRHRVFLQARQAAETVR